MADLASTRVFGKLTVMHDAIVKANAEIVGNVTAAAFLGDGSGITDLDATAIATGTVPDARLPTTATRWPAWSEVTSKPNFAAVATSGSYSDLSGVPSNATTSTDGLMSSGDKSKLDGIESGATADQTKADIDALGIDADTLDGQHASAFAQDLHTHSLSDITDAGTSAGLDAPADGDAAAGQVVKGDDSRLSDTRDPKAHTHPWSEVTGKPAVWHADNDGDGSGLDADLVGGKKLTVSTTAPSSPSTNDIWLDIS